jgi:hypothetical protein
MNLAHSGLMDKGANVGLANTGPCHNANAIFGGFAKPRNPFGSTYGVRFAARGQ